VAFAATLVLLGTAACTSAPADPEGSASALTPDVEILSTPDNVILGGFPIDAEGIDTVKQGEIVKVDTIASSWLTDPEKSPAEYFAEYGIEEDEVLDDMTAFWETLDEHPNYGPHTVTGPINIEGAEPGDTLMVEILGVETRTDFGMNYTGSDSGVFSESFGGYREGDEPLDIPVTSADSFSHVSPGVGQHLIRTGEATEGFNKGEDVAFVNDETEVPLAEFFGVMAVKPAEGQYVGFYPGAPDWETGVQNSIPPGPFGGNLDTRDYVVGSTLYLPVNQEGAGFFVGDGHAVQGDGEVSGTALEQSLTGTFRFTVLKGRESAGPSGEDAENFLIHGIDHDVDRAMKFAVANTVEFLKRTKGMTTAEAYSLASLSTSYSVSEAVDATMVVTGHVPKSLWAETGKAEQNATAKRALTATSTLTVPEKS